MAKGVKMSKYARRTSLNKRDTRLRPVILAVLVFLLLCFVVSVAVGLSLGRRAKEIEGNRTFDLSIESYHSGSKEVKAVDAYVYNFGADARTYIMRGVTDLSVCLRGTDGNLAYVSDVGVLNGFCTISEDASLSEQIEYIHSCGGYVCAYFYVKSFETEDDALRELYKSYEIALVQEAARCGADDIMLVGLNVNDSSIAEITAYVSRMAEAAEAATLGVLLPPEIFRMTEEGIYFASVIREACDYVALDLRCLSSDADKASETLEDEDQSEKPVCELELMLENMEYYIRSYSMRVVLSKDNAVLYDSAKEYGVTSIQIIEE
ncbi:MAG: hypothetical protein IJY39_11925 [Clostridia bacterium]|nr:hypothetical protein [Clostridia bacterium]